MKTNDKFNVYSFALFIFVIFYLPSIFNEANKSNIEWIEHNLWYYRVFIEYTISSLVLIFAAIILLSWNYKKIISKVKV